MSNRPIACIRIILDTGNDVPLYWPMDADGETTSEVSLDIPDALMFLRQGIPFVVAVADPKDKHSHYESEEAKLTRI